MADYDKLYSSVTITNDRPVRPALPPLPEDIDIVGKCRSIEDEIFDTYRTIMNDPDQPAAARKACADALLERARGKTGVVEQNSTSSISDIYKSIVDGE